MGLSTDGKHEIEGRSIFADPDGLDGEDSDHSQHEQRRQRIALSIAGCILFVVYTLRRTDHEEKETIRIISVRQASR